VLLNTNKHIFSCVFESHILNQKLQQKILQVHLDSAPEPPAPEEKEVDFFEEIASSTTSFGLPAAEALPPITSSIVSAMTKYETNFHFLPFLAHTCSKKARG